MTKKARKTDPCARLRDRIEMVREQIQELRDFLPESPPSERQRIKAAIARLEILLRGLLRALKACEDEHRDE
jgi:hypothetical protein